MMILFRWVATLGLLWAVGSCGRNDATQMGDLLPATPTSAPTGNHGSEDPIDGLDAGAELDGGEPDAEGDCRRGFAGAVGVVTDSTQPEACAVLLPVEPLDCIARRTECVSALSCPDSVWHESQWAFDPAGQAQTSLDVASSNAVHCTGILTPEGYDMHWTCTVGETLCRGVIRSYFE